MSTHPPTIVHLDADAFFVSCELATRPELRGRKVAVGGRERGIISSASYEARAAGVYTPMPTQRALRICPDLVLLPHTAGLYGRISGLMFDLCETLTPLVQRNSIDEGYLDLAPCGLPDAGAVEHAVRVLQEKIARDLAVPVSFGIGSNKLVSQIASKLRKPRGFVVVMPGTEAAFLAPLAIGKLPGIGAKTEAALQARGLRLIGEVLTRSEDELASLFGSGWRTVLAMARGEDDSEVATDRDDAVSYSQQETFAQDQKDRAEIERIAKGMIDELMPRIRADGKRVRTLTLRVRYADFSQESRGRSLAASTDLEAPFYPLVAPLLRAAWTRPAALRLIGIRFSSVAEEEGQLEMFAEQDEKRRRLAQVIDRLNQRGSAGTVRHGHQL
jgi:DNA polymerase-4